MTFALLMLLAQPFACTLDNRDVPTADCVKCHDGNILGPRRDWPGHPLPPPMTCTSCHTYTGKWPQLKKLSPVLCQDCHTDKQ